jgi:hypothetical protein
VRCIQVDTGERVGRAVDALLLISDAPTPFFLICLAPTLFLGSVTAA